MSNLSSKTLLLLAALMLAGCSDPTHTGPEMQRAGVVAAACASQGGKARIVSSFYRRTELSVDCFLIKDVGVER